MRSCLSLVVGCCLVLAGRAAVGDDLLPRETPIEAAIDHYIDAKLQRAGISPAPQADDAHLLRRTMLDLAGRIPTAAEARQYVASDESDKRREDKRREDKRREDKRRELVDRLLASPAFVRQQAAEFDALLMDGTRQSVRDYLLKAFGEGRPWDQMFREMLVGEPGDAKQQGAIRFVAARAKDQDKLTADTSVLFFGVNVSCAKCHDHPLVDDWKQDHYFGMLSFFSRTFDVGDLLGERDYGRVSFKTVDGESREARLMFLTGTLAPEPPAPEPDEEAKKAERQLLEELKKKKEAPPPPGFSRRAALVEAALSDEEQSFFARAIVNHLWQRLMGRGLVDPVDQMHSENPPSHPELLAWLARDAKEHGYDLKRLVRGIVLSQAYSRTSRWDSAANRPPDAYFAVAQVRPLKPWQYGTSLYIAAHNPDNFPGDLPADELNKRMESMENAGRSLAGQFELPRDDFQVSVDEALLFSNSERIAKELLRDGKDRLHTRLADCADHRAAAETAVWSVFSRPPEEEEIAALADYLAQREDRISEARRQLVWALLTSSECRFNY